MQTQAAEPATISHELAEFALSIRPEEVAEDVRHETLRILVDCVGSAVAGLVTDAGRIAVDLAREERGPLQARVIGAGEASLLPAVFANTVLTNALDFEPVGPDGHVCAVAVPVALAVAQAVGASGSELLAGLLAGLELGGRVGTAVRRPAQGGAKVTPPVRGTAHAAFAAAGAAGRLLGLTAEQLTNALGIAAYGASLPTLKKVMTSPHSPMTKYDHLGSMARNGVEAALLARRGFTGDPAVLEGDLGFWRFAGALGCDWDALTRDLGRAWTIGETWFKRYPVILYTTPGVDLVRRLVRENGIALDQIERIEVHALRTNEVQAGKEILGPMDAWTSYAYNVAAGLYDIRPWRAWQMPETYRRTDILALTRKVDLVPLRGEEVGSTGNYWEGWCPVRATVHALGRTFEGRQEMLPRIDDAELSAKFQDNVRGLMAADAAGQLERALWGLPNSSDARAIGAMLPATAAEAAGPR